MPVYVVSVTTAIYVADVTDELNRESMIPVYKQVADEIEERIKAGKLRHGRPIPSEATMMQEWGIARDTARRVHKELRDRGLVATVHGKGTFVIVG